jgi:hypothetical protein
MSNHYQVLVIGGGMQDFCSFKTAYQKVVLSRSWILQKNIITNTDTVGAGIFDIKKTIRNERILF